MFLHLLAFSQRTGVPVCMPSFQPHAANFCGTRGNPFCAYPPPPTSKPIVPLARLARILAWLPTRFPMLASLVGGRVIDCPNECEFSMADPAFEQLARKRPFVFLRSGWQYRDWKGLQAALPNARTFFRPIPRIEAHARQVVESQRTPGGTVVGVHIRQTDFRDHLGGEYFFETAFYAARMRELAGDREGVSFVVCSDAAQSAAAFPGCRVAISGAPPVVDLAVLAACDRVTGPAISSFGAWAALVGDKPFLALSKASGPVSLSDFRPSPLLRP